MFSLAHSFQNLALLYATILINLYTFTLCSCLCFIYGVHWIDHALVKNQMAFNSLLVCLHQKTFPLNPRHSKPNQFVTRL